jgi:hypothetical protein
MNNLDITKEPESPFGHWVVAGKKYYNKLKAVVNAVPNGWWPHFYFHEDKFLKYNWTVEPKESLIDLYKKRALLIRNQFDHITVDFSGGADSWTVLYSFLQQGLHVDTVAHRYVEAVDLGVDDKSVGNQASEAKYQAWPWFKKFQELDPAMEWKTTYLTDMVIDGWASGKQDIFQYNVFNIGLMYKVGQAVEYLNKIQSDKKSAIIYGIDKPNLFFENNTFYLYFPETPIMHRAVIERYNLGLPITDILFYWDYECAELLIKQGHLIMNWFKQHPDMIPLISNRHYRNTELYYKIINPIIYPDYQEDWQSEKADGVHNMTHEKWFHDNLKGTMASNNWHLTMQDMSNTINDTLVNTPFEDFIKKEADYSILAASWSKMYKLGSL